MELKVVKSICKHWYIALKTGDKVTGYYLLPDGILSCNSSEVWTKHWKTKEEAEKFLKRWMPRKELLTTQMVKLAAEFSDLEALKSSIQHWKQIVLLGYDRFVEEAGKETISIQDTYCALCQRHKRGKCLDCPLGSCGFNSLWSEAAINETNSNSLFFTKASINLLNELIRKENETKVKNSTKLELTVSEVAKRLGVDEVKIIKEEIPVVKKKHIFQPGDIVRNHCGSLRTIVKCRGGLTSFDIKGFEQIEGQEGFEEFGYEKVGELKEIDKYFLLTSL